MFGLGEYRRTDVLKQEITKLERERDEIVDANRKLKDDLAGLQQKRKIEDDEIRHLVKMKESALEMEHSKKALELERKKDGEVAAVKDQYRDKLEAFLQQQVKDIKEMYGEILGRLPNVNVRLKGEV